ncbi:universal stress protein [Nocardia asiatica]|uniref:universal stress protein n=1 Tax=Nocardia asiatica TaxID=209252 RepID=UPI003EE3EE58
MPPSSHVPVLVGVDDSRCSARAVGIAFDEAASRNVGLVAVTAWAAARPCWPRGRICRVLNAPDPR